MFYRIKENKLYDWANYKYTDECKETDILTAEDVTEHPNKVIVQNGVLVLNPNFEAEEQAKEVERIQKLKCTKRVLALTLQELGITYANLKALIATNEQAQLEWDLCIELERSNPLLDIMGAQLNLTSEQIDMIFKVANNEKSVTDLRMLKAV